MFRLKNESIDWSYENITKWHTIFHAIKFLGIKKIDRLIEYVLWVKFLIELNLILSFLLKDCAALNTVSASCYSPLSASSLIYIQFIIFCCWLNVSVL